MPWRPCRWLDSDLVEWDGCAEGVEPHHPRANALSYLTLPQTESTLNSGVGALPYLTLSRTGPPPQGQRLVLPYLAPNAVDPPLRGQSLALPYLIRPPTAVDDRLALPYLVLTGGATWRWRSPCLTLTCGDVKLPSKPVDDRLALPYLALTR